MKRTAPWLFFVGVTLLVSSAALAQAPAASSQSGAAKPSSAGLHHVTDPALLHPASLTAKAPDVYEVKFTTTKGDFVIQVTRAWAPLGADRFYNLVRHHFYDQASFFRVLPGFVVQFGMNANPAVNKVWENANIKDDPVAQSNLPGYITFATSGANSRTTQVFISLGNNARLDSLGFAPFGQVTSGMDVVQQLFSGYGEGAPDGQGPRQDLITSQGKPYLDKNFPKLDSIITATIISPVPAPAAHPATHKPSSATAAPSSNP